MVALARETRLSQARTRKQRGVTCVKGVADRMIDDAVGDGDGALRSLLLKIALVTPLPLVISFRIIGFKWAEDNMSGGVPAAFTVLLGNLFTICALPPLLVLGCGLQELRECFSIRYGWFIIPGLCNGMAKFLFLLGAKSVDATTVSVLEQCNLLWAIVFHSVLRRRCPDAVQVLDAVTVVTVASTYVVAQSTAETPLNVAGFLLVLLGLCLESLGSALLALMSSIGPSSMAEHLRAILANDVMKLPGLLTVFLLFELETVKDRGVEEFSSVQFLLGACMGAEIFVLFYNLCTLISGTFHCGVAGTLSVLVTYAIEVAVLQTRNLASLAVLQLVALTANVVMVSVTEYKILCATFQGRHDALVSMPQKMSVLRSTWVPGSTRTTGTTRTTQSPGPLGTTGALDRVGTPDSVDRLGTAGALDRVVTPDSVDRLGAAGDGALSDESMVRMECAPEGGESEALEPWQITSL